MHISGFGAIPVPGGVRFRVWAPAARQLTLVLHTGAAAGDHAPGRDAHGIFDLIVDRAGAGDLYGYRLDAGEVRPDPASRCQPEGVHGRSAIVDPGTFQWSDPHWQGRSALDLIVYELHVGTFSPTGTFEGVRARLPYLRDLGTTAIELMPVADFTGSRNWGYDGVCLFAPSRAYGTPDDLRRLVDDAHRLGLSVILDVVYNHFGPEGAYLWQFSPEYFTTTHTTPWGPAVNLDGPNSGIVRAFIIDNARHWTREYHLDGLRLDATHALIDGTPRHIVRELAAEVRRVADRPVVIHAEDHRNMAQMIDRPVSDGWGLDGIWADDFHHSMRRLLAGDAHAYFSDFAGTAGELATIVGQGWLFTGQRSTWSDAVRGTDPSAVAMSRFVVCIQNHDQIGNRATGERLHHLITPAAWRAASTVLLTAPMTPLLFMGQEWAASTPFLYFTDHEPGLGTLVTEGRRREFGDFPEFSSEEARRRIPDPQAASTFEASRLRWDEIGDPAHAPTLALYRALLALRLDHPALGGSDERLGEAFAPDADTLIVRRAHGGEVYWIVARLRGGGRVNLATATARHADWDGPTVWDVVMTTEEPLFATDPTPVEIDDLASTPTIRFSRPGAVVLRQMDESG